MENHLATAIPCAYWPQAARGMPSRCGPRHRDSGTRRRSRRGVVSNPTGAQQPPTDRIPCLEASAPMPDSMPHACALPIRNPPRRSLDAQGRTPAGGPQGPRHFFGFFAPCAARANNAKNCRRNTSISTPDFASSLAGTPAPHATHATQGTPQGRASESKEQDMNDMKEKAMARSGPSRA